MKNLSPKAVYLFFVENILSYAFMMAIVIGMVFLGILFSGGDFSAMGEIFLWSIIVLLLYFIFCFVFAFLKYRFWQYEIAEDFIRIKKGIIFRQGVDIPYSKIQNINTKEPPIYRIFGLKKVLIETAGQAKTNNNIDEAEGVLPGLNEKDFNELKEAIFSKVK